MLSPTNSPQRNREVASDPNPVSSSHSREGPSPTSSRSATTQTSPTPIATQSVRMLYGTLVASPMQLFTTNERPATMFIFPEISIRSRGRFRLQISLMRVPL